MRRILALAAAAALAVPALAGGEGVNVEVTKSRSVKSAADPAFNIYPVSYAQNLMCNIRRSQRIDRVLEEIVNQTLSSVRTINKEDVAVTLIEICPDDGCQPALGHLHGEEMRYASGIARVIYAAGLYYDMGRRGAYPGSADRNTVMGSLRDSNYTFANATRDMIGGKEETNAFLQNIGMKNFNVNQPFITDDPTPEQSAQLGRKLQLNYENSNRLTTNQTAALFYLMDQDALVSPGASQAMKAYMFRPLEQQKVGSLQGIAAGLPVGSKLVSANGYSVRDYHETGIITLPNGKRYILSVMTKYNNYPTYFIPLLSETIAFRMMTSTGSEDPAQHLYIPALVSN